MLLDPRNGPDWDLPPPTAPIRPYVIASSPRTGSTLLARLLWDTGLVGAPKEYLNPMQLRDWGLRLGSPARKAALAPLRGRAVGLAGRPPLLPRDLQAHLAQVIQRRSSKDGFFGLKLHFHHHQQHCSATPLTQLLGARPRWIHIHRQDRLAQAISWERALQSGRWASTQGPGLPQRYSRRRIQQALDRIERQERGWARILEGEEQISLSYESLLTDRQGSLRRILAFLGADEDTLLPPDPLQRQADHRSQAWAARFRQGL